MKWFDQLVSELSFGHFSINSGTWNITKESVFKFLGAFIGWIGHYMLILITFILKLINIGIDSIKNLVIFMSTDGYRKFKDLRYDIGARAYNFGLATAQELSEKAGYPQIPGMIRYEDEKYTDTAHEVLGQMKSLPSITKLENEFSPSNIKEIFWVNPTRIPERFFYSSTEDGFYNFFIDYFNNYTFLPDWVSSFIQLKMHYCLDLKDLYLIQETLVYGFFVYITMIAIRTNFYWWISLNPYMFPFNYFSCMIDWAEDGFSGLIPSLFGVDMFMVVFMSIIGVLGDQVNNLVLTMPYLPSERIESFIQTPDPAYWRDVIKRPVLLFHKIPRLWLENGVPNDIRIFWSSQRPDVFAYMYNHYYAKGLEIFPDGMTFEQRFIYLHRTFGCQDPAILFPDLYPDLPPLSLSVIFDQFHLIFNNNFHIF